MTEQSRKVYEMFAVMEGDKFLMVVIKDPDKPVVIDVTDQLAKLVKDKP